MENETNEHLCLNKQGKGFTLVELAVVFGVILALISVLLLGARIYLNRTIEVSCIVNQGAISTAIISQANLREEDLVEGIDYFTEPSFQEALENIPDCPAVGSYSAFLDPDTGQLVITCLEHGHGSSE